jgi:hypothetical protein
LQLKKIQGAVRNDIYECRVDQFWRLILQDLGGMLFNLICVGAHDDAIDHGAALREAAASYATAASASERIQAYLRGDETALSFRSVTAEQAGFLLGIVPLDESQADSPR